MISISQATDRKKPLTIPGPSSKIVADIYVHSIPTWNGKYTIDSSIVLSHLEETTIVELVVAIIQFHGKLDDLAKAHCSSPDCEISTSPCSFGLWYKSPIHICSFHPVLCLYIFHIFTSTGLCYTAEFRQWWCKEIETFCFRVFFAIGIIVFSQLVAQFVVSNIYPQPGCRQWHSFFVPSWSSCFCLRAAAAHTSMLFLKRGRQWPEIFLCSKDLGFLILLNSMVCGCCGGAAGTQAARWLQRERIQRDLRNHVSCFCFSWKTWAWNFDGLDSRRRILPQSVVWYARKYIAPFDFFLCALTRSLHFASQFPPIRRKGFIQI